MNNKKYKAELHIIDNNTAFTEVYHKIMSIGEDYSLLSPNIPKPLLLINQEIHYKINQALNNAYLAANKPLGSQDKLQLISNSKIIIFSLYSDIEYLVKTKALTIGAANIILDKLYEAHTQLSKWYTYALKEQSNKTNTNDNNGVI